MPFKTNAELPNWIKKAFSEKVQDVYRNAFNSTYEKTKDDGRASAAAISAVKKMGYVKKGDNWVKAEAGYVKDLGLKPGEYIHPNDPDKKLTITVDGLNDVIANTQKFLNAGGKVPLTVSHPNTEGEKIDATLGQMVDIWFDPMTQMPYGHFDFLPESEVNNWVKEGKLTEVSPGIYHDVITSAGKFASLIDHVAATSSPFNLGQSGFMPINAFKRYNSAYLFFENKYVSEEKGVVEKIAAFINDKFIEYWGQREHNTSQEGGDEMELKEALEKITELESDVKVLKGENETLKGENEAYKKKETERVETEKTVRKDTFSKKVDELIKLERVKPANRDGLIANFEKLDKSGISVEESIEFLLSRFETSEGNKNTLPAGKIMLEATKEVIDVNSEKGRGILTEKYEAKAKEIAAAKDDSEHWEKYYSAAIVAVNADLKLSQEKE